MGIIYLATNEKNGKQYVGLTVQSLASRKRGHENAAAAGKQHPFYAAIRRYGPESFAWEVVYSSVPADELDALEIACIAWYGCQWPYGYNLTEGGRSRSGWSDESKAAVSRKISAAKVGCIGGMLGRRHSPETIEKIRRSNIGKNKGKRSPWKGKQPSGEMRAKMRVAKAPLRAQYTEMMRARRRSPEFIAALVESLCIRRMFRDWESCCL